MLTCEDCYAVCEGQDKHPNALACDEFDGLESEVDEDRMGNERLYEMSNDMRDLYGAVAILSASIAELERKFDTIIAAVVKASGPEEER